MLRYGQRVEKYVGAVADYEAIDQFLSDGSRFIISNLPRPYLERVATAYNVGPGGYPVQDIKVAFVRRDGLNAPQLPPQFAKVATLSGSRWFANENQPSFYVISNRLFVLPSGGVATMYGLQMPTISHLDFYSTLPQELDLVVVLYASIQYMILKMSLAVDALGTITLTLPAQPPNVTIPSYVLNAGTYPDLSVEFTRLYQYLTTEEDLELARGQIDRIMTLINDWKAKFETALKEWEVERASFTDQMTEQRIQIEAWIASVQATVQQFTGNINKAVASLNSLGQSMQQIRAEYTTQLAVLGIVLPDSREGSR